MPEIFDAHALAAHLAPSPRPALTVYGQNGRVELSGRVVATWAYKTANLLAEEALDPVTVLIDLPPTWRAVPAALGVWLAGHSVAFSASTAELVFTDEPTRDYGGAEVFAFSPDPIALAWRGALDGARDGIAEVTGQADVLLGPPAPPAVVALADAGIRAVDLQEVLGTGYAGRLATHVTTAWELTRMALAQWSASGSLVAFIPGTSDAERLAAQEGATWR